MRLVNAASLAVCLQLAPGKLGWLVGWQAGLCVLYCMHALAIWCWHQLASRLHAVRTSYLLAESLAKPPPCRTSAGARLLASPDDRVQLLQSADEDAELSRQLAGSPASPAASMLARRPPPTSPQRLTSLQQEPVSPRGEPPAAAATALAPAGQPQPAAVQQQSTIEIVVSAVGVGLQFVHLDSGGNAGSGSGVRSAPGTRPGSGLSSQHASTAELGRAASQQLAAGPSQAALAAAAAPLQGAQAPPKAVQLLAAYLDIQASYRIEVSWLGLGMIAVVQEICRPFSTAAEFNACVPHCGMHAIMGHMPNAPTLCPYLSLPSCRARCRAGEWRCRACGWRPASSPVGDCWVGWW